MSSGQRMGDEWRSWWKELVVCVCLSVCLSFGHFLPYYGQSFGKYKSLSGLSYLAMVCMCLFEREGDSLVG